MCPEYGDLKKHIKTTLEKDKNVDFNQCNLSTRAKWHLRAHIDTSHKYFVISGYSLNFNLLLHWNWRHERRYWKDRRIKMHKHLNLLLHWNWRYEPRYWKDCIRIINFQFLIGNLIMTQWIGVSMFWSQDALTYYEFYLLICTLVCNFIE